MCSFFSINFYYGCVLEVEAPGSMKLIFSSRNAFFFLLNIEPEVSFYSLPNLCVFHRLLTFNYIISCDCATSRDYVNAWAIFPWFNGHHLKILHTLLVSFLLHIFHKDWTFLCHMIKIFTILTGGGRILIVSCEVSFFTAVVTYELATSLTNISSSPLSLSLESSSTDMLTFILLCTSLSLHSISACTLCYHQIITAKILLLIPH